MCHFVFFLPGTPVFPRLKKGKALVPFRFRTPPPSCRKPRRLPSLGGRRLAAVGHLPGPRPAQREDQAAGAQVREGVLFADLGDDFWPRGGRRRKTKKTGVSLVFWVWWLGGILTFLGLVLAFLGVWWVSGLCLMAFWACGNPFAKSWILIFNSCRERDRLWWPHFGRCQNWGTPQMMSFWLSRELVLPRIVKLALKNCPRLRTANY